MHIHTHEVHGDNATGLPVVTERAWPSVMDALVYACEDPRVMVCIDGEPVRAWKYLPSNTRNPRLHLTLANGLEVIGSVEKAS